MPERGRVRVDDGPKRIRTYLGGELVADSTRVKLVWEKPYYPVYYFPPDDVRMELLHPTDHSQHSPRRGETHFYDVKGAARTAPRAARTHPDSPVEELRNLIAFDWEAMDGWFEEDEEVHVHARDPYTRVDILPSSRRVQVEINGVTVADTTSPWLLFETGLPTRYYIPKVDVRMDLLTPTATSTRCPYKGEAEYWTVTAGGEQYPDIVWSYRHPVAESVRIAGLVSFYNEKVDIMVDGERQERPRTVFS